MTLVARPRTLLSVVPLLGALACGGETPVVARSAARLQILVGGIDGTGRHTTMVPSGFPRVTAAVTDASGAPSTTYDAPVLSASNPVAVRTENDGSLVLLAIGSHRFIATSRALSSAQDPQVLRDSATVVIVCTAEARPGLWVMAHDSLTGMLVTHGATLRAISGTWQDSLMVPASYVGYAGWATAWERADTYTVTVDRDRYLPWRRDAIVVPRDLCHVTQQTLDVRLVPR